MSDLLEKLTDSSERLPAVPEPYEPPEPQEPTDRQDLEQRGRSPDEVVQSRETRLPASDDDRRYEVAGRKYSARELEESGLLNDLAVTHSKYSQLQAAHQQELDRQRAEAQVPQVPQVTNSMIAQVYDPVAEIITRDLVDNYLVEEDITEAYPRSFKTLVGQLRWMADELMTLKATVLPFLNWLQQAHTQAQSAAVANAFNQQLDNLVSSDPSFYAGLKTRKGRDAFTRFLVEEINANVGQTCGAGAPAFLSKQWAAYNSPDILNAARSNVQARQQRASRRFVGGEAPSSRSGVSNFREESMLDRMISNSGKLPE